MSRGCALTADDAESPNKAGFPAYDPAALKPPLESRHGSQVFDYVAVAALLFGAARTLELAIEHGLAVPSAYALAGLAAGSGLILWSETFRRRAKPITRFPSTAEVNATSPFFLTTWAAFQLCALMTAPFLLGAMLLITAWSAQNAFAEDAELLAGGVLPGAFLTLVLPATGGDHETALFTYPAAIIGAVVLLQRTNEWPRFLVPTSLASVAYFTGYSVRFLHHSRIYSRDSQSGKTTFFAFLFRALFSPVMTRFRDQAETAGRPGSPLEATRFAVLPLVPLPSANAAFLARALSRDLEVKLLAALPLMLFNLATVFPIARVISAPWMQSARAGVLT